MRKRSANTSGVKRIIDQQTNSIPKTGTSPYQNQSIKSIVRNTLLESPDFPRLYADVVISSKPNSNLAKVLAANYKKITGVHMPVAVCSHIKVTGVQCGSPALRGDQFCYFHKRLIDGVKVPKSRIHPFAILEDEESIQASLMEIINNLIRGTIELKRAELILRALNTAVRNSRRVKFNHPIDMVRELPDDDSEPESAPAAAPTIKSPVAAPCSSQPPHAKSETVPNPARPKPPVSVTLPPDIKKRVATGKG